MQTSPVVAVDFAQGGRGSRIKLIITLEGGQKALFKPKWYVTDLWHDDDYNDDADDNDDDDDGDDDDND